MVIIGGGLAGLIASIKLIKGKIPCTVIEKKEYPFHRVCGEYVSNEVLPFLKSLDLYPAEFDPPAINRFQLSATTGKSAFIPLDLGGFGISRFSLDHFMYKRARELGVNFLLNTPADDIQYDKNKFLIQAGDKSLEADLIIGAYGKRSVLDKTLNRSFIRKRSPYIGVKYHIRTDFPKDLIALHNFHGGYCGISNVENGITNLCYLAHRNFLRSAGTVSHFEHEILFQNPFLKNIFTNSEFLFQKPVTINEISFETKGPVENHILMAGDAAGMIAPLCGNGMSIAIHSGKLVSDAILKFYNEVSFRRDKLEAYYSYTWKKFFDKRLFMGRQMQRLFGNAFASNIAVQLAIYLKPIANLMVRNSHGKPF